MTLTKSGKLYNHFAWLLKWWIFCQNFRSSLMTSHHCSKIDLLPESRKNLNYNASRLKIKISCQNLDFHANLFKSIYLHCTTAKVFEFLPRPWRFFNYISPLLKSELPTKIREISDLPRITAKVLDFWQKLGYSPITLHHS